MTAVQSRDPALRLNLRSHLSDLELLWPWVESLACKYAIPEDTLFAIHLCLEEVVSNIVRHGYGEQSGHPITVIFTAEESEGLTFTVEDRAPSFDPLAYFASSKMPRSGLIDPLQPGGHGIRLLQKFADSLAYERLVNGNRLTIHFQVHV